MIYWNLEIGAKTPGLDFQAEFTVPVFKMPRSDPNFTVDPVLMAQYVAPDDPDRDLRDAGVVKTWAPNGDGWRFIFPMARHLGVAAGFTFGTAICFGAAFFWPYMEFGWVSMFIGTICGLVGLLLGLISADLWFYRSVVDVSTRIVTVVGGLFGMGSPRRIETAEIVKIETASHLGNEKQTYFNLVLVCRDGRRILAGKRLPGKRLAASVIRQIEQSMGKPDGNGS